MPGLSSVINLAISRKTQGVTQTGFGIPLVLSSDCLSGLRTYSSLSAAVSDGLTSSTAAYKAINELFEQTPAPTLVKTYQRSSAVAQVVTVTPDVSNQQITIYTVTINGTPYAFTSTSTPTAGAVVTGLSTLINADSNCSVTASGSTTLILTDKNAGESFTFLLSAKLSAVTTTANNGAAEDILAANQADNSWYMLIMTSQSSVDVKAAAAQIESMPKMFLTANSTSAIATSASSDLMSYLMGKAYTRTALIFSGDSSDYPDAGWAGRCLPTTPGSENWMFKSIVGITPDNLTDTQRSYLDAKNANYYITLGGVNIAIGGKVASGEYIDIIRGTDALQSAIQTDIFGKLVNLDKIPFTDAGIAIIESRLRAQLENFKQSGFILSYTVTVPLAANISSNDKAARTLNGISFVAVVQGAVDKLNINGIITY